MWFKASAPGSLMLLGEYAVLRGGHAIVCAIDRRITVNFQPREDTCIRISSQGIDFVVEDLKTLSVQPPFQFVLAVLKHMAPQLRGGCDIRIDANFSDQMGFASSAAVTVATLAAIFASLDQEQDALSLIRIARDVVRSVQGVGSGADVAACVLGGIVQYCADPLLAKVIAQELPLTVLYSGAKTKTTDAIRFVEQRFADHPQEYDALCQAMDACAKRGVQAIQQKDNIALGKILREQQQCMEQLGVNTPSLADCLALLNQQATILGAKISGSGLGDCVIGLGLSDVMLKNQIPIAVTQQGVCCETKI